MIQERIKCAAVRLRRGEIVKGYKHAEIRQQILEREGRSLRGDDGFVTDFGRFVNRAEAAKIAIAAGQVFHGAIADEQWGLSSSELSGGGWPD